MLYITHTHFFLFFFYPSAFYLIFTLQRATLVAEDLVQVNFGIQTAAAGAQTTKPLICRWCAVPPEPHPHYLYVGMLIWSLQQHFKSDEEDKVKHRQSTEHFRPVCILSSLLHVQHHIYYRASISVLSLEATGCSKQKWTHLTVTCPSDVIRGYSWLEWSRTT